VLRIASRRCALDKKCGLIQTCFLLDITNGRRGGILEQLYCLALSPPVGVGGEHSANIALFGDYIAAGYLADAMKKHPARLSGFGLPTAAPDKATHSEACNCT
jgi:hypothetical protein